LSGTYTEPQIISKIMTIIDDIDIILVSHHQYLEGPKS
jgi:predicted SnoaL-like aldol condensation-catalyzing enzyme